MFTSWQWSSSSSWHGHQKNKIKLYTNDHHQPKKKQQKSLRLHIKKLLYMIHFNDHHHHDAILMILMMMMMMVVVVGWFTISACIRYYVFPVFSVFFPAFISLSFTLFFHIIQFFLSKSFFFLRFSWFLSWW